MKRILIADDRATSRELLRTVLERQGYAIIEAADGEEALQKARAEAPDLILLDLQMPRRTGYEVLRELRGDPRMPRCRSLQLPPAPCRATAKGAGRRIHRIPDQTRSVGPAPREDPQFIVRWKCRRPRRKLVFLQQAKLLHFVAQSVPANAKLSCRLRLVPTGLIQRFHHQFFFVLLKGRAGRPAAPCCRGSGIAAAARMPCGLAAEDQPHQSCLSWSSCSRGQLHFPVPCTLPGQLWRPSMISARCVSPLMFLWYCCENFFTK